MPVQKVNQAPTRTPNPQANKPAQPPQNRPQGGPVDVARRVGKAVVKPYVDTAKAVGHAVKDRFIPPMTDRQQNAAKYMKAMLGKDKLGGNDRTFNHRDIDAVAKGIQDRGFAGAGARALAPRMLREGLDQAGVKEDKTAPADDAERKVTRRQLESFQKASEILKGSGTNQLLEKLGLQARFPSGISQDAIGHLIDGKLGLPPGAEIVPKGKDGWNLPGQ